MTNVQINFEKKLGKIKPMHAVNNGPIIGRSEQTKSNFNAYKEAGIPYARNHDASFASVYGGEHTVDISAVFPDFDADAYLEESYDFIVTDEYIRKTELAGTRTFYRLGSKIEHGIKKYGTIMPKDFHKWAVICEHIIKHYTEGWANGFHYDMEYWEIWNEPDLTADDAPNKPTWSGTTEEFYEFYVIASKHLKEKFPHLKIGGPASAGPLGTYAAKWQESFMKRVRDENAALDFFSWHLYTTDPIKVAECTALVRERLDKYGFYDTESILNEWNYIKGWSEDFIYSIKSIIGLKGAAFTMAGMTEGQKSGLDMLMYYDARPNTSFNGLFDFYTFEKLKGYYPFKMFNELYKMGTEASSTSDCSDIYCLSAANEAECGTIVTYYNDDDSSPEKEVSVSFNGLGSGIKTVEYYLLDEENDMKLVRSEKVTGDNFTAILGMTLFSSYYIRILTQ